MLAAARGELPDEEDDERYEVDFLRKGMEQQGRGEGRGRAGSDWGEEEEEERGGGRGGRGGPVDTALAAVSGTGGEELPSYRCRAVAGLVMGSPESSH